MYIRNYAMSDCGPITEVFYQTVHAVNAKDYTKEQLDAWAAKEINLEKWHQKLSESNAVVAVENDIIVGFGNILVSGYLDCLYVHKDYQNQGIATAICDCLEQSVTADRITVHASITAMPFFAHRGYRTVKEQQVCRKGIFLKNYEMEKLMATNVGEWLIR